MWVDIVDCISCKYYGGLHELVSKVCCKRKPPPNCNNYRYESDDGERVDCPDKPCPQINNAIRKGKKMTEHTGKENLEHWLAYHSGTIDADDANELRQIVDQIVIESNLNCE